MLLATLFAIALAGAGVARAASLSGNKPLGVIKRGSSGGAAGPGTFAPSVPGAKPSNTAIDPALQLTYHGGPVMHTHTIHAIFWEPTGFSFPAGYETAVQGYLQNVALDSGKTSNAYGAITQYGDGGGPAQYNVTYGGSAIDTSSYPVKDFTNCGSLAPVCLTDAQLYTEIENVRVAQGWLGGLAQQFVLVLPQNVTTCFGGPGFENACSDNFFCAYHSWDPRKSGATTNYYLDIPFEDPSVCHSDGVSVQPQPNGQVDVALDAISHEEREAATDPLGNAWYDANGNEADDKCIDSYGSLIGQTGSMIPYNQAIGVGQYDTQLEWSNALRGCYQMGKPVVSSIVPGSATGGSVVTIDGANFFAPLGLTPTVLFNGHPSPSVTVNSPTQLTATVPSGTATGKVIVQAVGGSGTSTQVFGLQPTISSFSVASGFAGQSITVSGAGFFGVTSVKFNGTPGVFSGVALDGSSLHVVIPAAATTGAITVTTAGGTGASSGPFVVLPHVTGFTPPAAVGGANVTISGTGFSGLPTVDFTGSPGAVVVSHTATAIVVHVPVDATSGPITVTTADGSSISVASFKPLPKVTGFDQSSYLAGDTVTVSGSNFTANGPLTAKLGIVSVAPTAVTATSFQFTIPANGLTGLVSVTNGNGRGASPTGLKVRPTVAEPFAPTHGTAGTVLTLGGNTYTGTSSVKVGGVAAPFVVLSVSSLRVTIPAAALSGPFAVTNAGGVTTTVGVFTVDPRVSGFAPLVAVGGATVTISGTGLAGASGVSFNGVASPLVTPVSAVMVRATVPVSATNGPVVVTTAAGSSVPFGTFKPLPSVTPPAVAQAGDDVTVNGANLIGASVKLGATAIVLDAPASATSFSFVVPNVVSGTLSITTPGGTTTTGLKVRPTVAEPFAPTHGTAGTVLTLGGNTYTGTSSVKVGGVAAPFVVLSVSSLRVTIPAAALSGPFAVTNAGGVTTTVGVFTVDPRVSGFAPLVAVGGATVTISGTGLAGASGVSFNGVASPLVTPVSAVMVRATVPVSATNGPVVVTTAAGSSVPFGTFKPLPKITGFDQAAYLAGDTVTVSGSNFTANGALTSKLGATPVAPSAVTPTSFQFTVPANGLTGFVIATDGNGSGASPAALKVRPTVSEPFAPTHGTAGTVVTLGGNTYTGTSSVKVGGVAAPFAVLSASSLRVTIPGAALSGPIAVTNAGGTTTTVGVFTVDPKITSFAPLSGSTGTTITVTGSGFAGADQVNFGGGTSVAPTNVTATSLKAVVPAGTATGPITVHTPAGTSPTSAGSFTITLSVTSISPTFGSYNQDVTVTGVGLTGLTAVKFNGIAGAIQPGGTATVFHVHAPASGSITCPVTILKALTSVTAPQQFTLLDVTSLAPTSGTPGTSVVITGHGFTGATHVRFNGTDATFTVNSSTQITASVPHGATDGTISVTVPAGTATSAGSFTVESLSGMDVNEFQTSGTTSQDEFVELYNGSASARDISGAKLVYHASGSSTDVVLATIPASTMLASNGFYVLGGQAFAGTAQQTFTTDLDATGGGLALEYPDGTVVDSVGYGTGASFVETAATAAPASGQSESRQPNGADTNDNSADFHTLVSPTPGS